MDKTLKLLLACLGITAIAILAIPSGDPLAQLNQTPIAAANSTDSQPVNEVTPVNDTNKASSGKKDEGAAYVSPQSDQSPTNTVDSAAFQQQTFGQPMFDPRPESERQVQSGNAPQPQQAQVQGQAQPQPNVGNTSTEPSAF